MNTVRELMECMRREDMLSIMRVAGNYRREGCLKPEKQGIKRI